MKKNIALILTVLLIVPALANSDDLADKYFLDKNPALTPQEKAAIAVSKQWESKNISQPAPGPDGSVRFLFGAQRPSIVCAPLQICDISLQVGEQVNAIHLGDTARWTVEPAVTGSGASEMQHLIIKPMDVGLETSLVVTTNRRTYNLKLRSHRNKYMPAVSFAYPEEALVKWDLIRDREKKERNERTIPQTGEYLDNLDFEYELSGSASWKPIRVYNDGRKTIIQMPAQMEQTEAPALLVVRREGEAFSEDETVLVNYRVQNDRYIVDSVFHRAILIAGVGSNQDRVTITRRR